MKGTAVPAIISILVLLACLFGCAKSELPGSAESPSSVPTESGNTDTQTLDVSSPIQRPVTEALPSPVTDTILFDEFGGNEAGLFRLGMTREKVKSVIKANGIVDHPAGDERDMHHICFYLHRNQFNLFFGENGQLEEISVVGDTPIGATSTLLGLNLGDPAEKAAELYGEYKFDYYGYPDLYKIRNHYLSVSIYEGIVDSWGIWRTGLEYQFLGAYSLSNAVDYMFGGYEVSNIIRTLGEPYKKETMKDFERWYFEQGIEIDVTVIYDDYLNMINYVYVNNHSELKTDRGIGIGSTYEEVIDAYRLDYYPEATNEDLIMIGPSLMYFVMKDNKVSSIYITRFDFTDKYRGDFVPDRP